MLEYFLRESKKEKKFLYFLKYYVVVYFFITFSAKLSKNIFLLANISAIEERKDLFDFKEVQWSGMLLMAIGTLYLFIPIIEECVYRMSLRPSKLSISFLLSYPTSIGGALLFVLIYSFTGPVDLVGIIWGGFTYVLLFFSVAYIITLDNVLSIRKFSIKVYLFLKRNGKALFFVFPFFFALLHLVNISLGFDKVLEIIAYLLPLFFFGLGMNILRLKLGLFHAILYHSANNIIGDIFSAI